MPLIGFQRNLRAEWLDEIAALVTLGWDEPAIRETLDDRLRDIISTDVNRRQTIDILAHIWVRNGQAHPGIHSDAVRLFGLATSPDDRITLHAGLALLAYSFFREAAAQIGRTLRFGTAVRTATLQREMPAIIGDLGGAFDACRRVTSSLRNWGLLVNGEKRFEYVARQPLLRPSTPDLTGWLLAAALRARPADALPLADLVRLPELFAFDAVLSAREAADHPLLSVRREASGWDMVSVIREA